MAHPNRNELFQFLKVQLFEVGINTPRILKMGTEWNISSLESLISMFGAFGIIVLLILLAKILNKKKSNQDEAHGTRHTVRLAISLSPLLVLLFAASIKSLRFTEYFQPLLALEVALLASSVNWRELIIKLKLPSSKSRFLRNIIPSIIILTLIMIPVQHIVSAYSAMHLAKRFFNTQYQAPMAAISLAAKPGDLVYNSMWDEFPVLFFQNQDLRYVSGLDPTFLYKASSTMALDYQNLVFNSSSTQAEAYSLIHDRLHANFILLDYERWPHFANIIAEDQRYTILAEGDGARAYIVSGR